MIFFSLFLFPLFSLLFTFDFHFANPKRPHRLSLGPRNERATRISHTRKFARCQALRSATGGNRHAAMSPMNWTPYFQPPFTARRGLDPSFRFPTAFVQPLRFASSTAARSGFQLRLSFSDYSIVPECAGGDRARRVADPAIIYLSCSKLCTRLLRGHRGDRMLVRIILLICHRFPGLNQRFEGCFGFRSLFRGRGALTLPAQVLPACSFVVFCIAHCCLQRMSETPFATDFINNTAAPKPSLKGEFKPKEGGVPFAVGSDNVCTFPIAYSVVYLVSRAPSRSSTCHRPKTRTPLRVCQSRMHEPSIVLTLNSRSVCQAGASGPEGGRQQRRHSLGHQSSLRFISFLVLRFVRCLTSVNAVRNGGLQPEARARRQENGSQRPERGAVCNHRLHRCRVSE